MILAPGICFQKHIFPAIFVSILNFCIKCIHSFDLEMVLKFWSGEYVQSLVFLKNHSPAIFGSHIEYVAKHLPVYKKNPFFYLHFWWPY